ncbi:hypothetical protein SteCoe_30458 [Stentor coeruleus]|uniref:Rab-GAP TBC domain-containing protein n=1 Tax=Stentor coeruleus TaxID=5963 RepID=A0A1R2B3L1_9CILI|nr:hypothetical protein SteCoe_30458 [Stentor coeruleus]
MDLNEWKKLLDIQENEVIQITTTLDLPNQRIIASDVDRTRTNILSPEEKSQLELLLTFYCKEFNTAYKQGMNEIMAPFLLMAREGFSLSSVYVGFKNFLHKHLPTMFADQSFKPLQAMFLIFRLLLRYFDPRLSTFFLVNHVEPQSFVTSWYITLFAGKINNLTCLYYLWKEIIYENDQLFPLYLSLAIIQKNRDKIACCQDKIVPQVISQIFLDDLDELKIIINSARQVKGKLPYSIAEKLMSYDIFNLEHIEDIIRCLEKEPCLTILPQEIVHRAYPEVNICKCDDMQCPWRNEIGHRVPLVVIDCRTIQKQSAGIFPNSVLLNDAAYIDSECMMNFPDQFMPMRGLFHFCLMGSETYNGTSFDLSQSVSETNDIIKNMLENLLQAFLMKGFPYISFLEGGFEMTHNFAQSLNLYLENHDKSSCHTCIKNSKGKANSPTQKPWRKIQHPIIQESYSSQVFTSRKTSLNNEKFLFICHKYENNHSSKEDYMINLSSQWFGVSIVTNELIQEVFKTKISGLCKLSFIKKNPKVINVKFEEMPDDMFFLMKSADEAKLCVGQIARLSQALKNAEANLATS